MANNNRNLIWSRFRDSHMSLDLNDAEDEHLGLFDISK